MSAHSHDGRYYTKSTADSTFLGNAGGNLTGDLYLPSLYASGVITGDGSGLTNLNANRITKGTIAKAIAPSIEDSFSSYYKSNKIDDALFIGLNSFVKNYAKNYSFDYLQKNIQNKTDDDVFNEILEGTKIISSIIIENI